MFNPLPESNIIGKGYLKARILPNSPTDNPQEIIMQVLNGWAYATGDLILGTNPVSDYTHNIAEIEIALKDVLETFEMQKVLPWCVFSHIDKQHAGEEVNQGSTAICFQSFAGCDQTMAPFGLSIEPMVEYAKVCFLF